MTFLRLDNDPVSRTAAPATAVPDTPHVPHPAVRDPFSRLQATRGNRAVRRLLRLHRPSPAHEPALSAQPPVQRISQFGVNGPYFSDADLSVEITPEIGVISAATTADTFEGGHAIVYLEYLRNGNEPLTLMIDLFNLPQLGINIEYAHQVEQFAPENYDQSSLQRFRYMKPSRRRYWVISRQQAEQAHARAVDIKNNIADYRYTYTGTGLKIKTKPMNCARFAQKILKAAGVPDDEASAGALFKVPRKLVEAE